MRNSEATRIIQAAASGDRDAAEALLPMLYSELRRLAESRLARLPAGQTLQATALVHEAFLRLVGEEDPGWDGRAHFFGAAARTMRDILVDQARRKGRLKHGGGCRRVALDDAVAMISKNEESTITDEIVSLDAALRRMEEEHPRAAEVVMYRYFAGLNSEQTASILGVSARTVEREWRFARAWLRRAIEDASA